MKIKNLILSSILMIILSCATDYKRGPEGGPNDKISPKIEYSSINDTALNMDKDSSIEIEFSEYIDVNSSKNSVIISPRSASKKAKILWYDKGIEIKFKDLEDDQTVVIAINPSLKDTQGNSLTDSYSLSFSTGGRIDKKNIAGAVNGAIIGNKIETVNYSKIKVNLYSTGADSLKFIKGEPEYSTGLSKDSRFELKNVGSGSYRIIAFNDLNNDSKPQFETEMAGFVAETIDLTDKDSVELELTMGNNDKIPPFVKSTTLVEKDILKIEFSEEIRIQSNYIDSCYVNNDNQLFSEFISTSDKKNIYAKIKNFKTGDQIKIKLRDIKDEFGNTIKDVLRSKTHTVSDTVKDVSLRITGNIPKTIPSDQTFSITSNRFSNDSLSFKLLQLKDSLLYELDKGIKSEPYRVFIDLKLNNAAPGNYEFHIVKADSTVYAAKLTIEDILGSGSVSGKITGHQNGNLVLICKDVKGGSSTEAISGSDFKIDLVPGKYICAMISDTDSDGIFSLDHSKNISEKAVFYNDTVFVRKNWETADINFEFK